jgi:hypothetical protein
MSVHASDTVRIDAPLEDVLAVVRDVDGQADWWPGMLASEVLRATTTGWSPGPGWSTT